MDQLPYEICSQIDLTYHFLKTYFHFLILVDLVGGGGAPMIYFPLFVLLTKGEGYKNPPKG